MPYLISGGFAGLGLMVVGSILASVLGNRRDDALADQELADVLADLADVSRAVIRRRTGTEAAS
jgi:hypothetical protein